MPIYDTNKMTPLDHLHNIFADCTPEYITRGEKERLRALWRELSALKDCIGVQPLTPFQQSKLWYLVHRYRRQHGRCPCLVCLQLSKDNPYQGNLFSEQEVR